MSKEIVINAEKSQTRIALVEDGNLVELYIEDPENERTLGDIYLGRVRRTMPSIQAAFIDIGQKQDAFLHFSDLADNLPEWLELLDLEKPEVARIASRGTLPRTARRRRPQGRRPSKQAGPNDKSKKGEDDDEAAEAVVADGQRRGRGKVSADARRGRRSAQRRNRQKQEGADGQQKKGKPDPKQAREKQNGQSADDRDAPRAERRVPPERLLKREKPILVKIVKEPISAKGSRVSTDISLAGRFLVLVPLANYVAVSKKIYSFKERRRLRTLAKSLLPEGFGVIVRTVAEGKKAKELDTDLRLLVEKWRKIEKKLENVGTPPVLLHEDVNMASSVIRDLFSDDYDRILIDDPKLFRNVKNYVQAVAPQMVPAVQHHKGKKHVFKAARIAREVAQAFESRVDLPSGGYLFIEHTEAMHVIDVNSGRAGRGLSQEENSLKVDLEAVKAIAKQIRLRDLGGIIVVDFIDLRDDKNRRKVYNALRNEFRKDRAVTKALPMSDFGLVEITRQRLRPSITKTYSGLNGEEEFGADNKPDEEPAAKPKAKRPPRGGRSRRVGIDRFMTRLETWISGYRNQDKRRVIGLKLHPFTAAFLNQKLPTYPTRWLIKHFVRVRVLLDENLDPFAFRFVHPRTGEDLPRPTRASEDS